VIDIYDQYLEDVEQTCNVCDAGYNDPLNVFATTKNVVKLQRAMLPVSDDD
jgi:hypothetical protein